MLYLDTSVLVAVLTSEPNTGRAQNWLARQTDEVCAVSDWVSTEFSAAVAGKVRKRELNLEARDAALGAYRNLVDDSIVRATVLAADFERGARLADQTASGLRGGDALHLAIAERCGATLCTLDKKFVKACERLGLPALSI